jgi:hypothetical protein
LNAFRPFIKELPPIFLGSITIAVFFLTSDAANLKSDWM